MNCEKNHLARVIPHRETYMNGLVDVIVRVTELAPPSRHGIVRWMFEGRPYKCRCNLLCTEWIDCIPDEMLRPIRDPGPDAVDEMVLRLPAPQTGVPA